MKIKKILIIISSIALILLITFFIKNNYNSLKIGNNISNKSADEIKEYILNIESYEAKATVTIKSNKNENTYILLQQYNKQSNIYKQVVIEPNNIAGVQFIYDGTNLKVENTELSLVKIYEKYQYIESNELSLVAFIEDFKENEEAKCYEENGMVLLETSVKNENKYLSSKKLHINKDKGKIEKLEIKDITQNTKIYILYNEMEINELSKDEILAFSIETLNQNI